MTQDGTDTKHEWRQVSFSWGSWIECSCGFRPESQEDMDKHITPEPKADFVEQLGLLKVYIEKALEALDDEHEASFKHWVREVNKQAHELRNEVEVM